MEFFKEVKVNKVNHYSGCLKCSLPKNKKVEVVKGKGKKGIILLLPPITAHEAIYKEAISTSQLHPKLAETFREVLGIDIDQDCYSVNAILCPGYRKAGDKQKNIIKNCQTNIYTIIKKLQPKLIYSLGTDALKVLFEGIYKDTITADMDLWRGFQIPHKELGAYVVPIYSSQDLYRTFEDDKGEQQPSDILVKQKVTLLGTDIKNGYRKYGKKLPTILFNHNEKIKLLFFFF